VSSAASTASLWVPFVRRRGVLPGYRLALGFVLLYLCLIVLLPLSALVLRTTSLTWAEFVSAVTGPRALAAYRLSFGASLAGALLNVLFGVPVAWVLARYRFPGRALMDAAVDLPFALPTAVAGIALTSVYAENGWLGQYLEPMGIQIAFGPLGVMLALTFVGFPFVVRTVQPVIEDLDPQVEEAAAVSVILPTLYPAILTGFALSFARALGEYGSVVFISGNMPLRTEIVPLLIVTKLEQYDYGGATALATVMLVASFLILLSINALQRRRGRK
jgi:sulfate transport system permease protein